MKNMKVLLALVSVVVTLYAAAPVLAGPVEQGIQRFKGIIAETVTVTKTLTTVDLAATDDLTVADDMVISDDADIVGDLTAGTIASDANVSAVTSVNGADVSATDDLTVGDDAAVSGDLVANTADITGSLQFGTGNLYPLGYASDSQEIVCGTTSAFTGTTIITPTGLTTVTYVVATMTITPAATAAFLTVSDPTTSTFILYSQGADYATGTTGVTAHYCALGDK